MRCPDCNKFVSYDDSAEPEVNDLNFNDGTVTGNVRVVLNCGDCGTELKEAAFDFETKVEVPADHRCYFPKIVGCPAHEAGKPCAVCGWDGVPNPAPYAEKVKRYNPPQEMRVLGMDRYLCIGSVGTSIFDESERDEFEQRATTEERKANGIPAERVGREAFDQEPNYEADGEATLTTRSDCGVNRKTGKPNKYNPRYATTYYGFDLNGTAGVRMRRSEGGIYR